jgi:hypothetical protein
MDLHQSLQDLEDKFKVLDDNEIAGCLGTFALAEFLEGRRLSIPSIIFFRYQQGNLQPCDWLIWTAKMPLSETFTSRFSTRLLL